MLLRQLWLGKPQLLLRLVGKEQHLPRVRLGIGLLRLLRQQLVRLGIGLLRLLRQQLVRLGIGLLRLLRQQLVRLGIGLLRLLRQQLVRLGIGLLRLLRQQLVRLGVGLLRLLAALAEPLVKREQVARVAAAHALQVVAARQGVLLPLRGVMRLVALAVVGRRRRRVGRRWRGLRLGAERLGVRPRQGCVPAGVARRPDGLLLLLLLLLPLLHWQGRRVRVRVPSTSAGVGVGGGLRRVQTPQRLPSRLPAAAAAAATAALC